MVDIITSFRVPKEQADAFELLLDAVIQQNETVLSIYDYRWYGAWQEETQEETTD